MFERVYTFLANVSSQAYVSSPMFLKDITRRAQAPSFHVNGNSFNLSIQATHFVSSTLVGSFWQPLLNVTTSGLYVTTPNPAFSAYRVVCNSTVADSSNLHVVGAF